MVAELSPRSMVRISVYLVVLLCAWGVLAFGAVYPWAYWPLSIGSAGLSAALLCDRHVRSSLRRETLAAPLVAVFGAIALQLLPLPANVLDMLSPSTRAFLEEYDLAYALAPGAHPVSIRPQATALALVLGAAFALLMLVIVRVLRMIGARKLVIGLAGLGFLVAMIGIVQRPLFTGKIYGFWEPVHRSNSFGPFVNPNHFAGWMAMCLPLTLGLVCGQFATAMRRGARTWRDYVAWASGPEANGLVLLMMAAATMGLGLVLSLSRSGIACFLIALLGTAFVTLRRQRGVRRQLTVAYLTAVAIGVLLWAGPTTVAREFDRAGWVRLGGRVGAWTDALSVVRAFPLTGSGLNSYGTAMVLYQRHERGVHYTAAHNDYLQLAAEGGLLVALPATWVLVSLIRGIRGRFRQGGGDTETYWIRVGAVTGLAAIALQSAVDFSLQIPGNAILFACLCAIAVHRMPGLVREAA